MKRDFLIALAILLLFGSLVSFSLTTQVLNINEPPLIVVLSPHFDDGIFSLGGMMVKQEYPLFLATFFTKRPAVKMHTVWDRMSGFSDSQIAVPTRRKENVTALASIGALIKNYDYLDFEYRRVKTGNEEMAKSILRDIKSIMVANQGREIFIYGPATFGQPITHPDHQIVHEAFMEAWLNNKLSNVHFFIYEDFPYVYQFNRSHSESLREYLNKTDNVDLQEKPIPLDESQLLEKIAQMDIYKSQIRTFESLGATIENLTDKFYRNRCTTLLPSAYACEVVYKLP